MSDENTSVLNPERGIRRNKLKYILALAIGLLIFYLGNQPQLESNGLRVIVGLVVAIVALLFMILKTRIPAFPALIIAAIITVPLAACPAIR